MRSRIIPVLALACGALLGCDNDPTGSEPATRPSFITDGNLDGNAHPAVVLIVMDVGGSPGSSCSRS
jgi:hypothetical protein